MLRARQEDAKMHLYEVELEQQNRELRSSRQLLEDTLDLYANLYDFAAIACATLDHQGCIRELNLTGAALLGNSRNRLIGKPFSLWLETESLPAFFNHVKRCKQGERKVVSKLSLKRKGHPSLEILLISKPMAEVDSDCAVFQSALIEFSDLLGPL